MRRVRTGAAAATVLILAILAPAPASAEVTVSAAISLKGVLEKSKPVLEKAAGDTITFTYGASGTLAGQIQQGAPVDLFISADRTTVDRLLAAKLADPKSVQVLAGNALCLVQAKESSVALGGFADLTTIKRVAIGEPKVVPAGVYARESLTALKLWEELDKAGKIVTSDNVAQVVTLVERGEVEAGIVYRTDLLASSKLELVATADPASHGPIEYVSVIVSASKRAAPAAKVQEAIRTGPAAALFKEAGFAPAPAATRPATP
jgi:molybdate transport system substrate-binding protein